MGGLFVHRSANVMVDYSARFALPSARDHENGAGSVYFGICAPCGSNSGNSHLIKIETTPRWGGARPGAGGKPRPVWRARDQWQWFVVRTGYDQEMLADCEVRAAGFEVFNPSVWEPAVRPRRNRDGSIRPARAASVSPMFPRYFFVRLNLADPDWYRVRSQEGVDYIVSGAAEDSKFPGIPVAVPEEALALIRNLCELNDCHYPEDVQLRDIARPAESGAVGGSSRFLRRMRRQADGQVAALAAQVGTGHGPLRRIKPVAVGSVARLLAGPLAREDLTGICGWSAGKRLELLTGILGGARITVSRASVEAA